ncbi:MAG: class I fructose-bisphosphate aldolase [Thermoproteus sp.]
MHGKHRRLQRIFGNGKAFIAALDHGVSMGPIPGLEDPVEVVKLLSQYVDGFILNRGIIEDVLSEVGHRVIIYKLNGITQHYENPYDLRLIGSVEDALSYDADAVSYEMYIGGPQEPRQLEEAVTVIREAARFDLPVILHIYPHGEDRSPEKVAHCLRLGWELGADIIKTFYYRGMGASVGKLRRYVLIAGGPKLGTPDEVMKFARDALNEGVAGLALGRNLWGWPAEQVREIASYIRNLIG